MTTASTQLRDALARTVLLVKRDIFPSLAETQIADGLAAINVRIVSDAENLGSPAAQTAVVATAIVLTQSGAAVVLDIPDVALAAPQPPLEHMAGGLSAALSAHLDRLPARRIARPAPTAPDLVVAVGDTPVVAPHDDGGTALLRITGDSWSTELIADLNPLSRWSGDQPFGAILCASALGAEAFRLAMRKLVSRHRTEPLTGHRLAASPRVRLAISPIENAHICRCHVDFVSGGAITNAAMFSLQRVPGFAASARVFDDDIVQTSNLNRYPMLTLDDVGVEKVNALGDATPPGWAIEPVPLRLDAATIEIASPLAPQVLVGVDDIPSRWLIQRHAPAWLCVAGTSHFEVVVSEHVLGAACAGCMHPQDDPGNDLIPTVAFVSLLAGSLQAHRLVSHAAGKRPDPPVIAWSLGLDGEHGILRIGQSPRTDCPVRCTASEGLRAAVGIVVGSGAAEAPAVR